MTTAPDDQRLPAGSVLVVTGTDTGVGKTHVSRALVRALARAGRPVVPLKLIETGCLRFDGELLPDDGLALARAARREDVLAVIAPERFELPASPLRAARAAGRSLEFSPLREHVRRAREISPKVLLEGAGGILVPIGLDMTFGDFAGRIGARIVIVARDLLGTINHSLLTAEAARRRGLQIAAVILNSAGTGSSDLDHAVDLRELLPGTDVYGPLPWLPGSSDDALADAAAAAGLTPDSIERLWG